MGNPDFGFRLSHSESWIYVWNYLIPKKGTNNNILGKQGKSWLQPDKYLHRWSPSLNSNTDGSSHWYCGDTHLTLIMISPIYPKFLSTRALFVKTESYSVRQLVLCSCVAWKAPRLDPGCIAHISVLRSSLIIRIQKLGRWLCPLEKTNIFSSVLQDPSRQKSQGIKAIVF